MPDQDEFLELSIRVRSGSQDTVAELVRQIEPFMLRVIRIKMRGRGPDDPLRHDVSSMDVCQSVMASFFDGLTENRFSVTSPEKIRGLLRTIPRVANDDPRDLACVAPRRVSLDIYPADVAEISERRDKKIR